MAEHHEHGSMDTTAHEKTFASFLTIVTRVAIGIIVSLVLLSLING